jgi:hypothetical protein
MDAGRDLPLELLAQLDDEVLRRLEQVLVELLAVAVEPRLVVVQGELVEEAQPFLRKALEWGHDPSP